MEKTIQDDRNPNQSIFNDTLQKNSQSMTSSQRRNKIYQYPAPFRIFPLPNLVPHNPLSLLHFFVTWLSQLINPPISQIIPSYHGWFSYETYSVHVNENKAIRGLWEQGFYGKGSLSRSEPNWLEGERARRENKDALISEEFIRKRRAERQELKWERARKERHAIDQQLSKEAEIIFKSDHNINYTLSSATSKIFKPPKLELKPPVGPIELLSLPNSQLDLETITNVSTEQTICHDNSTDKRFSRLQRESGVSLFSSPNFARPLDEKLSNTVEIKSITSVNELTSESSKDSNDQKSSTEQFEKAHDLRVKNTTASVFEKYQEIDLDFRIPSSTKFSSSISFESRNTTNNLDRTAREEIDPLKSTESSNGHLFRTIDNQNQSSIRNEEHLQLTLEEAFFLSYALGCLHIMDPITKSRISTRSFFKLCKKRFSPAPGVNRMTCSDNTFIINYIVYHHFRSLGWVVRSGIKFSVDYLLYNRGPVFSHAEFSVLILPSYSDPYWTSTNVLTEYSKRRQHRTWAWMSCINRVTSQVKKTLVLCYVDIPSPLSIYDEEHMSFDAILARYKIREFILSRFLTNRMRS